MYGQNCRTPCGHCLDSEQCHPINGMCVNGCDNGYQGLYCTEGNIHLQQIKMIYNRYLMINNMVHEPLRYLSFFFTNFLLEVPIILQFKSSNDALREGKSAWFELLVLSTVVFEVQWFHNEDLITNASARYKLTSRKIENGTLSHLLNIASVLQRDNGKHKLENFKNKKAFDLF